MMLKGFSSAVKISFPCIFFLILYSTPAFARQAQLPTIGSQIIAMPADSVDPTNKLEQLRAQRISLSNDANLTQDLRKTLLEQLDTAIQNLLSVIKIRRQSDELRKMIGRAPERLQEIQKERKQPATDAAAFEKTISNVPPDAAEIRLSEMEATLAEEKNRQSKWEKRLQQQKMEMETLPQKIAEARSRLQEIENELAAVTADKKDGSHITRVKMEAVTSEKMRTLAEIDLYEKQMSAGQTLMPLFTDELELAMRRVAQTDVFLSVWRKRVQEIRQTAASRAIREAETAKRKTPERMAVINAQYDVNIQMSRRLEEAVQGESGLQQRLDEMQKKLRELAEEMVLARDRLADTTISETIGLALREQRLSLPDPETFEEEGRTLRNHIREIQVERAEMDRMHRDLLNLEPRITEITRAIVFESAEQKKQIISELRKVLKDRQEIVDRLRGAYTRILRILRNMGYTRQQILNKSETFSVFLDRRLLWLRSSKSIGFEDISKAFSAFVRSFMAWSNWKQTFLVLKWSVLNHLGRWVMALLGAILLLFFKKRATQKQDYITQRVLNHDRDSMGLTLQALSLNLYVALVWPALMGFVAYELRDVSGAGTFPMGLGNGLMTAAANLAGFLFLYHFSRIDGPARVHFQWPDRVRSTFHRNLTLFIPLMILTKGLITVVDVGAPENGASLVQLTAMVQSLISAAYLAVMLRFSGGITGTLMDEFPKSWLSRLRYIWYPLVVGIYLLVTVLVVSGYYYSALEIGKLLQHTTGLAFLTLIVYGMAVRALTLGRHRLLVHSGSMRTVDGKDESAARVQDMEATESARQAGETLPEASSMRAVSRQSRSLLNAFLTIGVLIGLWLIWSPALPALQVFHDIVLWTYTVQTGGVAETAAFTLAGLVLALLILIATFVAYRNIPGLLEIILLNRLPMDPGLRYAFSTLSRYTIAGLGVVVVFQTIGMRWSSIQWLIAALGVGLGFGLQETVANFISGLIVLFERPFRINDTVTIGDVSGTVTRIRIRATTIRDWDNKELIVPNKEFITGRLINWTLSDNTLRLKFPIGIAYGSDVDMAEKLLVKAAREDRRVLKDPEPNAVFLGFGDNSLNFELRAFIGKIDDLIPVLHNVNRKIDQKFREADISISFPQRDVHLDFTQGPVTVKLMDGQESGTSEKK